MLLSDKESIDMYISLFSMPLSCTPWVDPAQLKEVVEQMDICT